MTAPKLKPNPSKKYRLITRSDMDGLVCAVLLKELGIIDDISFAHPKDMQDGLIDVDADVITTNLPYVEGVYLAFDHHASEITRTGGKHQNHVIDAAENDLGNILLQKFYEAGPYVSLTDHDKTQSPRAGALHPHAYCCTCGYCGPATGPGIQLRPWRA